MTSTFTDDVWDTLYNAFGAMQAASAVSKHALTFGIILPLLEVVTKEPERIRQALFEYIRMAADDQEMNWTKLRLLFLPGVLNIALHKDLTILFWTKMKLNAPHMARAIDKYCTSGGDIACMHLSPSSFLGKRTNIVWHKQSQCRSAELYAVGKAWPAFAFAVETHVHVPCSICFRN
jgi:hypothetical protein